MNLPDFLEELNQGAENAFDVNYQSMVDSLRYANLPPKLKHTAKTDGLEIVTYLENKLELNTPGSGLLSSGIGITLRASIEKNMDISK